MITSPFRRSRLFLDISCNLLIVGGSTFGHPSLLSWWAWDASNSLFLAVCDSVASMDSATIHWWCTVHTELKWVSICSLKWMGIQHNPINTFPSCLIKVNTLYVYFGFIYSYFNFCILFLWVPNRNRLLLRGGGCSVCPAVPVRGSLIGSQVRSAESLRESANFERSCSRQAPLRPEVLATEGRNLKKRPQSSVTFLAGHGEICPPTWVIHMATRRPAHNTPIHMDLVPFHGESYKKSMWIGALWAGLRAAM